MTRVLRNIGLALVAIAVTIGCSSRNSGKNYALDSFKLRTLQGTPVDVAQYQGKTVFINVWASWCKPCIQEMPSIEAAMESLKDRRDIVFLFASSEEYEEIVSFRDSHVFPFDYVQLQNLEELRIEAIPSTYIFNGSGEMIFGEEGYRNWNMPENLSLITQAN